MATEPAISFRPLATADFPDIQRWLRAPHVGRWWRDPSDLDSIAAHYGPCIAREDPTRVYIIERDGRGIGLIQSYRWGDYPDHAKLLGADVDDAGVDLFIGEVALVGRGLGPAILRAFIAQFVFADWTIAGITVDPEAANAISIRAFAKAGFAPVAYARVSGETTDRQVMRRGR